jgi:K+-sensing histidine kinase KdpD
MSPIQLHAHNTCICTDIRTHTLVYVLCTHTRVYVLCTHTLYVQTCFCKHQAQLTNTCTHTHTHTQLHRIKVIHELRELVEQKERFMSSMSHELRTPLNGIIGLSDALIIGSCGEVNEKVCAVRCVFVCYQ